MASLSPPSISRDSPYKPPTLPNVSSSLASSMSNNALPTSVTSNNARYVVYPRVVPRQLSTPYPYQCQALTLNCSNQSVDCGDNSSNVSYSSIWSPAAIAPVSDLMSGNSCMQRATAAYHHHQMANSAPPSSGSCYTAQGYGPPSAYHYGNMDYLPPPPMPHHHAVTSMPSALNQMSGGGGHPTMSSHMNSSVMSGHGLHGSGVGGHQPLPPRSSPLNGGLPTGDCLEYNSEKTAWKFQVL